MPDDVTIGELRRRLDEQARTCERTSSTHVLVQVYERDRIETQASIEGLGRRIGALEKLVERRLTEMDAKIAKAVAQAKADNEATAARQTSTARFVWSSGVVLLGIVVGSALQLLT